MGDIAKDLREKYIRRMFALFLTRFVEDFLLQNLRESPCMRLNWFQFLLSQNAIES